MLRTPRWKSASTVWRGVVLLLVLGFQGLEAAELKEVKVLWAIGMPSFFWSQTGLSIVRIPRALDQ